MCHAVAVMAAVMAAAVMLELGLPLCPPKHTFCTCVFSNVVIFLFEVPTFYHIMWGPRNPRLVAGSKHILYSIGLQPAQYALATSREPNHMIVA